MDDYYDRKDRLRKMLLRITDPETEGTLLSVPEALEVVEFIREVQHDDETAHVFEDDLREAVLLTIVELAKRENMTAEIGELATAALLTNAYDFNRWCA